MEERRRRRGELIKRLANPLSRGKGLGGCPLVRVASLWRLQSRVPIKIIVSQSSIRTPSTINRKRPYRDDLSERNAQHMHNSHAMPGCTLRAAWAACTVPDCP